MLLPSLSSLRAPFALLLAGALSSCATLSQIAALQQVDFSLDRVTGVTLAGVDVTEVRSFTDLSVMDGLALGNAVRRGTLPTTVDIGVLAYNPSATTEARIIEMTWTLWLDDTETVSGVITDEIVLPQQVETPFPVRAELDLMEFFDGGVQELYDIATSLAGVGDERTEVSLTALPVVQTILGPIRYDRPIRIVGTTVGGR